MFDLLCHYYVLNNCAISISLKETQQIQQCTGNVDWSSFVSELIASFALVS